MSVKTDNEHYKRVERYAKEIQNLYFDIADECAKLTTYHSFESGIFTLKDYPVLNKKVDKLIEKMRKSMFATIHSGISKEWDKANENNDELLKHLSKRVKIPQGKYQTRNLKALEAFQNRKIQGLNLSQRVWNYSTQYKTELEQALDVGIADGRSAAELSRDIRSYLREPEKLFRRVRDKNGTLKPSKNALKYNPGRGVYRSSYKNAMRLTRTEINMSYREADHLRWKEMDFVVGIEIRRSNHEYGCPVCESLKGKYPKDFKFSGWHPHCRCHAIPILSTEKELLDSIENDTPINSKNEIKDLPENFTKWIKDNENRIIAAKEKGTLPYFLRDKKIQGLLTNKDVDVENFPINFDLARIKSTNKEAFNRITENRYSNEDEFFNNVYGGRDEARKLVTDAVDDSTVYMAIDSNTLKNKIILGDGKFKNSLETGKGTFKTIGDDRAIKERAIFGLDENATVDDFPKYGFLSSSKEMGYEGISGWGYGDSFVKFKRSNVVNRTSITLGDSYDGNTLSRIAPPTKMKAPDEKLLYSTLRRTKAIDVNSIRGIDEFTKALTGTYTEAQIYGKLVLDDVESIAMSSIKKAKQMEAALKKIGRSDIKVVPCKFDHRLKKLISDEYSGDGVKYASSLKPTDVDALGDYYIEKLSKRWINTGSKWMKNNTFPSSLTERIKKGCTIENKVRYGKIETKVVKVNMTIQEKREFLKDLYRNFEDGKMPKVLQSDYRKSFGGWTDDVLNKELLKRDK